MKLKHKGLITISICYIHNSYHAEAVGVKNKVVIIRAPDDITEYELGSPTDALLLKINKLMEKKNETLEDLYSREERDYEVEP